MRSIVTSLFSLHLHPDLLPIRAQLNPPILIGLQQRVARHCFQRFWGGQDNRVGQQRRQGRPLKKIQQDG